MNAYDEIKKLQDTLNTDQELRERYRETVEELVKKNSSLPLCELAALAAEQIGYDLSANAFETAAQMEAVSDDEIENVSGGRGIDTVREFNLNAWLGSLLRGLMLSDSAETARLAGMSTLERRGLQDIPTPEKQ